MTSFPYLKIARDLGVPYGTICRLATLMEGFTYSEERAQISEDLRLINIDGDHGRRAIRLTYNAIVAEHQRRRQS